VDEHQQSYRHIQSLRETTATLDEQLTDLLTILSETRLQLLSVPSTTFPTRPREVSYTQLLSYASKISKFSRPSNPAAFRKHFASALQPHPQPPKDSQQPDSQVAREDKPAQDSKEKLPLGLFEEDLSQLDPSEHMPFTPWPSEEVMRQGALALVGPKGVPQDMVPEMERKAAEEKEKAQEEKEKTVNGKAEADREEERRRRDSAAQQAQQREKPAISLSLDLYEPDDD